MQSLAKSSFRANLTAMQILGFYPPKNYKKCYKIYSYCVYVIFTILIPLLAAMNLLVGQEIDLGQISDNAFLVCQTGCFIVKFLPFVKNDDLVKKSIYMLEAPIFNIATTNDQREIILECVSTCRRNCRLFLTFCLITLINWAIIPFFIPGKHLPIEIWLPFNYKTDQKLYILSFLYAVAGVGNGALSSGVIDPLLAGLTSHATSQIRLLKNNLEFLEEYAEKEIQTICVNNIEKELRKFQLIYEKIKLCVRHHDAILDFVDTFENTYSLAIFFQFAASVVVICISCLRLSMVEPFTFTFFAMILFLCTMLAEVFLYCYYGTILFEENNTLISSIYMGKWYNYDVKSQRALITLMERSKRPLIITAGQILDLSLETFTTILRRAYSLLAVLKNY
ncbi:hypothetical protein Zmor_015674 [Zophobas morio]|uniref:Odorant receptor n=1 Tax=Zophobas morio TaxID=2755281 RepID=A0AA38IHF5_9CUCU|nr:hypothetical protein Zmor_015674 [Zophobas morio]